MNHVARQIRPFAPFGLAWTQAYPSTTFSIRPSPRSERTERTVSRVDADLPSLCDDDDDEDVDALPVFGDDARVRDLFIERGAEVERACAWRLTTGSGTDVGRQRRDNQDALLTMPEERVFMVADGMGGHQGGGLASSLAIGAITGYLNETRGRPVAPIPSVPPEGARLIHAFVAANRLVTQAALRSPNLSEMGTTLVGIRFVPEKGRLFVAHVGDSRCYRLRDGILDQLTRDHTVATPGPNGHFVHRLSRAIGPGSLVDVDLAILAPREGDTYLLCSDGLNRMLAKEQIRATLESVTDPAACAQELIARANAAGGTDNVSAIVVRVAPLDA